MQSKQGRFLSVEIVADGLDPFYKVKYVERVEERSAIRFERREGNVKMSKVEELIEELIRRVGADAG